MEREKNEAIKKREEKEKLLKSFQKFFHVR
jgi:hypothetical protein